MTRTKALTELRDKVAAGSLNFWEADNCLGYEHAKHCEVAFFGSLDAAKALFEAVLGGWVANIYSNRLGNWRVALDSPIAPHKVSMGLSKCPARAWLIAILSALIAQEAAQAAEGVE